MEIVLKQNEILVQNNDTGKQTVIAKAHFEKESKNPKSPLYGWVEVVIQKTAKRTTAPAPTGAPAPVKKGKGGKKAVVATEEELVDEESAEEELVDEEGNPLV